jgi:Protein of unknown function (DUF4231)
VARGTQRYVDQLCETFGTQIEGLDALTPAQRAYLSSRWLDQLSWLEAKSAKAQRRYYALRMVTVVGAVMIPALVGLDGLADPWDDIVRAATWIVSLVTAASAAVEGFFRFGERWRTYRRTAEQLKTEGWLYLQLAGRYGVDGAGHNSLYSAFVNRVEEIVTSDVEVYLTEIAADRAKSNGEGD